MKSIVEPADNWTSWIPNTPSGYYEGCSDIFFQTNSTHQNILDIEMEIVKNGATTILRDTFYVTGQNGTDTLKLFY